MLECHKNSVHRDQTDNRRQCQLLAGDWTSEAAEGGICGNTKDATADAPVRAFMKVRAHDRAGQSFFTGEPIMKPTAMLCPVDVLVQNGTNRAMVRNGWKESKWSEDNTAGFACDKCGKN